MPSVPGGRAGERAFFVAEEFGFDQLGRHRRAVERNERPVAARALLMQRARDQLLSRAGFAENATRVSLAATRSTFAITLCITADFQTSSCLPARCFSRRFSSSRRDSLTVFSTVTSSFSVDSGFSRKSTAPSRVARTAISMLACPETITTGVWYAGRLQFRQQREAVFAGHDDVRKNDVEALRFR